MDKFVGKCTDKLGVSSDNGGTLIVGIEES